MWCEEELTEKTAFDGPQESGRADSGGTLGFSWAWNQEGGKEEIRHSGRRRRETPCLRRERSRHVGAGESNPRGLHDWVQGNKDGV